MSLRVRSVLDQKQGRVRNTGERIEGGIRVRRQRIQHRIHGNVLEKGNGSNEEGVYKRSIIRKRTQRRVSRGEFIITWMGVQNFNVGCMRKETTVRVRRVDETKKKIKVEDGRRMFHTLNV